MSRTIKEIYNEAIAERNRRLELTEFASDSKMSVMNGILWVVAAVIYSFESLLDVFAVDISEAINGRINGTPAYYANALLQYQQGDELTVREDGLAFGYANIDETKRIVTQVSYMESTDDRNLDSKLILKVANRCKRQPFRHTPERTGAHQRLYQQIEIRRYTRGSHLNQGRRADSPPYGLS